MLTRPDIWRRYRWIGMLYVCIYLVGCATSSTLTDTKIWQGYFAITTSRVLTGTDLHVAIDHAKREFVIQRVAMNSQTNATSAYCGDPLPSFATDPPRARVDYIFVAPEMNHPDGTVLAFVQWEGSDQWFVTNAATGTCYHLADH